MGQLFVEFDPTGYFRNVEAGFDWQLKAQDLYKAYTQDPLTKQLRNHQFFLPEDASWLLPQPRQRNADWDSDSRISQHVLRQSGWAFSPNLVGVTEFTPPQKV